MYNFKHGNMLRIFIVLVLLCIFGFLFLQNIHGQAYILLLVTLALITALSTYSYTIMEGLVISIGLAYLVILISVYAYWAKAIHLEYLKLVLIVFAAYIGTNIYKYILCFMNGIKLKSKAVTDSATGLFTQRYLELKLESVFNKAYKRKAVISLIAIGVDSGINEVAGVIRKASRSYDFIARYDKEGFCVILPQTKEKQALLYAEKLKKSVENNVKIKVNFGIVNFPDTQVKSWQELLQCAELALYKAKESNAIHVYRNH